MSLRIRNPSDLCHSGLLWDYLHIWVPRYWDKFGTGIKVRDGEKCSRCGNVR